MYNKTSFLFYFKEQANYLIIAFKNRPEYFLCIIINNKSFEHFHVEYFYYYY